MKNWAYGQQEFPSLDETLTVWAGVAPDDELSKCWKLLVLHAKPTKLRKMSKDTLLKVIGARTIFKTKEEQEKKDHLIELEVD